MPGGRPGRRNILRRATEYFTYAETFAGLAMLSHQILEHRLCLINPVRTGKGHFPIAH